MDDTEDDARYPPNPYPQSHRRPLPPPDRSNIQARNNFYSPQIPRGYADENEYDDDEEEQNEAIQPINDAEDEEDEENDDVDAEEDDESSDGGGKRRKLDKYAHGFELVPRAAQPPAPKPPPPAPSRAFFSDWSEESTFTLLDAWGDLYLQNARKSLRSDQWSEVAKKVSHCSKISRSKAQCRNRVDTLKRKYKKEKAKFPNHGSAGSNWVYFRKMDELMSLPSPPPAAVQQQQQTPPVRLSCGVDAGEYVFGGSRFYLHNSNGMEEMGDSPGDTASEDGRGGEEDDESDGLPPRREKAVGSSGSSYRVLADSIQKFGEIYEKMENSKRQQMAELERMRNEFHRDLELQKRQILERAHAEIARLQQGDGEEEERADEDGDIDDDETDVSADNLSG